MLPIHQLVSVPNPVSQPMLLPSYATWITVTDFTLASFSSCSSILAPSNLLSIQETTISKGQVSLLIGLCPCCSLWLDNPSCRYCIFIHHNLVIREALANFSDEITWPMIKFSTKCFSLKHLGWLQCMCWSSSLEEKLFEGRNCVTFCSPLYPEHLEHSHETFDEWMNIFLLVFYLFSYALMFAKVETSCTYDIIAFLLHLAIGKHLGAVFYWQIPLFGCFAVSDLLLDFSFGKLTLGLCINSKPELVLAAVWFLTFFPRPMSAPGNTSGLCRKGNPVVGMWSQRDELLSTALLLSHLGSFEYDEKSLN